MSFHLISLYWFYFRKTNLEKGLFMKLGEKIRLVLENIPNGKLFLFPNYKYLNLCYEKWGKLLKGTIFKEEKGKSAEESEKMLGDYQK